MFVHTLLLQYARYSHWAHKKLFDLINTLSPDQHHTHIPSSFTSLYKTALHIWGAETLWLSRLKQEIIKIPGDPFEGSMEKLSKALDEADRLWIDWFSNKDDVQLTEKLQYTNVAGQTFTQPYDLLLTHIFNHNTYHNGQLVTMLRALGVDKIPSTDFVTWTRLE